MTKITQIIKNGTKTVSVDGAVSEIYGSTLTTSVKDKVTQTFVQGLQTNITGAYDLDVGTNPNDSTIIGSIAINTPTFDIDSVTSIAMDSANINLNQGTKGAARNIVLLNTGAAIYCAGIANSIEDGILKAKQSIDHQKALKCFNQLNRFKPNKAPLGHYGSAS